MGFGIGQLNKLERNMTISQVRGILGEPSHKELRPGGGTVYKYNLFKIFQGMKPCYIVFDENGELSESYVDEAEFLKRQDQWLKAFKSINR
jgi:hypothetical protein